MLKLVSIYLGVSFSFRSATLLLVLVSVIKPSTHHSSEQYPVTTTRAEPLPSWSSTLVGLGLELLEQMMIMEMMAWPLSQKLPSSWESVWSKIVKMQLYMWTKVQKFILLFLQLAIPKVYFCLFVFFRIVMCFVNVLCKILTSEYISFSFF